MIIKDETFKALKEACEAAVAYDNSIAGAAARGEVNLDNPVAYSTADDLDDLYMDWQQKSRKALDMIEGVEA